MAGQDHYNHSHPIPENKSRGIGKTLLYLLVFSIAGMILFKYYQSNGGSFTGDYANIPKEVQINYVPADFHPEIDEENALAILANPYRYEREFNQLVYDFNLSLLFHVANRMNLPDSLKRQINIEYDKRHPYIKDMYFDDFSALQDTTSQLYAVWYENENTTAVSILNEVASKYTCFLITQILASLLETDEGRIYVKGNKVDTPCGIAITEGLAPLMKRLNERAAVRDFSSSKGFMKERVESAIAELATMSIRDRKGISKQLQTKVWGLNISTTDVEMSAISMVKVGFRLDKYFDISLNPNTYQVLVTLPNPEILSHEVYPRIDKMDIGWMRELQGIDLNKNIDLLRREFRQDVYNSDVMEKAKERVKELMDTMMTPLIYSLNKKYRLLVQFRNVNPSVERDRNELTPLKNVGQELKKEANSQY